MSNEMKQWIEQQGVTEVECIVPDMAGSVRGKTIAAAKFDGELALRLPQCILIQTVTGAYPELFNEIMPTDLDMLLRPDPSTLRIQPWATNPCGQVINDCFDKEGNPIEFAPRHVLRRVLDLYRNEGWDPIVAPELEFYLLQPNTDARDPLQPPAGRLGRQNKTGQSFSVDAVNDFAPMFDDLNANCKAQSLQIDGLLHEEGTAQMEINLLHGDPLALADQAFLFKRSVRETALRHNLLATFMAKPIEDQPGSAMHIHQSVVDLDSGKNIFSTAGGKPNRLLLSHIAGLQAYLPDAMALLLPYVNSYRRVVRHMSAPINFHWGYDNRTVGFRVPDEDPKSMRVENRLASADVNPYLAIAVSLACGYLGMKRGLKPSKALTGSAYDQPARLSRDWYRALHQLSDSRDLRDLLGDAFVDVYVAAKEVEFDHFMHAISPWEREHLLLKV